MFQLIGHGIVSETNNAVGGVPRRHFISSAKWNIQTGGAASSLSSAVCGFSAAL